jgi:hypothetical protein
MQSVTISRIFIFCVVCGVDLCMYYLCSYITYSLVRMWCVYLSVFCFLYS